MSQTSQMLRSICLALSVAVAGVSLGALPQVSEAKRLGGGKPAGMQRATPSQAPTQPGSPARQQTPQQAGAQAPAAAPQAAPKRSWLGPLAGLAAGLGIAALLSHFGMGEAVGNFMMMLLLAGLVAVAAFWLMRKLRGGAGAASQGPQLAGLAGAGAPWPAQTPTTAANTANSGTSLFSGFPAGSAAQVGTGAALAGAAASVGSGGAVDATGHSGNTLPADFDAAGFERIAKMIFIRMQAANDSADLADLRKFTTPELFASLRLDLQERGDARQQTDVVQLNAGLADWATEGGQQVASVRFSGLIREEAGAAAAPFDEVWHLVRPADASEDWRIAGITPAQ
jgi:predicted lipid-binding transport protein (Tim44 family)